MNLFKLLGLATILSPVMSITGQAGRENETALHVSDNFKVPDFSPVDFSEGEITGPFKDDNITKDNPKENNDKSFGDKLHENLSEDDWIKFFKETYNDTQQQGAAEGASTFAAMGTAFLVGAAFEKGREKIQEKIIESEPGRAVYNKLGLKTDGQEAEEKEKKIEDIGTKAENLEQKLSDVYNKTEIDDKVTQSEKSLWDKIVSHIKQLFDTLEQKVNQIGKKTDSLETKFDLKSKEIKFLQDTVKNQASKIEEMQKQQAEMMKQMKEMMKQMKQEQKVPEKEPEKQVVGKFTEKFSKKPSSNQPTR